VKGILDTHTLSWPRGVLNFYNAGVVTRSRRTGSRSPELDGRHLVFQEPRPGHRDRVPARRPGQRRRGLQRLVLQGARHFQRKAEGGPWRSETRGQFFSVQPLVPFLQLGPPFFPIILFLSTTLSTGITCISLHKKWPLNSQSHGSNLKENNWFFITDQTSYQEAGS
jgi:hypothetical protein